MLLDVPHAVMGEVAHQHLPPQVQYFIHHVPKSVEQIPLILLWKWEKVGRKEEENMSREKHRESVNGGMNGREIDREERQNEDGR